MKNLVLALMTAALVSCGNNNNESLKGNTYTATGDADLKISIGFDENDNNFHGRALNSYFGSYQAENGKIKFSLMGSTMMAGPEQQMNAERTYFQFLDKAESYHFESGKLIINTPDESMTFEKNDGE